MQATHITISSAPVLTLTLVPSADNAKKVLNGLGRIILKYENLWADDLSKSLLEWSFEVLKLRETEFNSSLLAQANAKIVRLRKILVNPLDQAPLQEPVLERGWLWEKWQLEDYKSLHDKSPFDNHTLTEAIPHEFAKAMLVWMNSLPVTLMPDMVTPENLAVTALAAPGIVGLDPAILTTCHQPADRMLKLFTYCQLARNARNTLLIREGLRRPIEQATQRCAQLWQQAQVLVQQQVTLASHQLERHEQELNHRLENIEQTHRQTTGVLGDRLHENEQQLNSTRTRLQQAEDLCQQHEADIAQLRANYAHAMQQVGDLQNSLNDDDSCFIL